MQEADLDTVELRLSPPPNGEPSGSPTPVALLSQKMARSRTRHESHSPTLFRGDVPINLAVGIRFDSPQNPFAMVPDPR